MDVAMPLMEMCTCLLINSPVMVIYVEINWKMFKQAKGLSSILGRDTLLILHYGSLQSQVNQAGTVPGALEDQIGIYNPSAKPGESSWNSPWGPGRPDWNIQSGEMSMHDLNPSFDIHGGARNLIIPHHEAETAQSCAARSANNVHYWICTDFFLNGNGSIELRKRIGDFITIREVLRLYHPLALRFFLIDTHYQSWVHYTCKELENASDQVFNIYQALYNCEMTPPFREKSFKDEITPSIQDCIRRFRNCFQSSMACDLHAYCALNAIGTAMKTINIVLNSLRIISSSHH